MTVLEQKRPDPKHHVGQPRLYLGEKLLITNRQWNEGESTWEYQMKGKTGWIPETLIEDPKVQAQATHGLIKDFTDAPVASALEAPAESLRFNPEPEAGTDDLPVGEDTAADPIHKKEEKSKRFGGR